MKHAESHTWIAAGCQRGCARLRPRCARASGASLAVVLLNLSCSGASLAVVFVNLNCSGSFWVLLGTPVCFWASDELLGIF